MRPAFHIQGRQSRTARAESPKLAPSLGDHLSEPPEPDSASEALLEQVLCRSWSDNTEVETAKCAGIWQSDFESSNAASFEGPTSLFQPTDFRGLAQRVKPAMACGAFATRGADPPGRCASQPHPSQATIQGVKGSSTSIWPALGNSVVPAASSMTAKP